MRYEEISFLCSVLGSGVRKVALPAESLVRKARKLPERAEQGTPIRQLTGGSLLGEYAEGLAGASTAFLNISLDTLDPVKFAEVTRLGEIDRVISG